MSATLRAEIVGLLEIYNLRAMRGFRHDEWVASALETLLKAELARFEPSPTRKE